MGGATTATSEEYDQYASPPSSSVIIPGNTIDKTPALNMGPGFVNTQIQYATRSATQTQPKILIYICMSFCLGHHHRLHEVNLQEALEVEVRHLLAILHAEELA